MTPDQLQVARDWLKTFYDAVDALQTSPGGASRDAKTVLKLTKDKVVQWAVDDTFDEVLRNFEKE